ncbi:MAG: hypothetical protein AAF389_14420 [Gemmatimonadota bacterium]
MKPRYLALLTLALCTALPLSAQDNVPTSGIWYGVATSAGSAKLSCDLCDTTRDLGGSVELSFGAWANPALRVGVDGGAWTRSDGDVREKVYSTGVVASIYPRPGSGLHLIGGLGWAGFRAEEFSYDAVRLRLGAGWDLPLTESWVAGNSITLDGASFGSLNNAGTPVAESVGLSVARFTLYIRRR